MAVLICVRFLGGGKGPLALSPLCSEVSKSPILETIRVENLSTWHEQQIIT
jgi:hypothetical protein